MEKNRNIIIVQSRPYLEGHQSKINYILPHIRSHYNVLMEEISPPSPDSHQGIPLTRIPRHLISGIIWKSMKCDAVIMRNIFDTSLLRSIRLFQDKLILEISPSIPFDFALPENSGGIGSKGLGKKVEKASKTAKLLFLEGMHQKRVLRKFNQNTLICPPVFPLPQSDSRGKKRYSSVKTIGFVIPGRSVESILSIQEPLKAISVRYPGVVTLLRSDAFLKLGPPIKYVYRAITDFTIDEIYSGIDIFVFPAVRGERSFYGNSIFVLHALARKIPCIAWKTEIDDRVFRDGEDMFIVSDEHEFPAKISRLIDDSSLREEMAEKGYEKAEKHFSPQAAAGFYLRNLDRLLREK